eukprot:10077899-Alexandrium_andersonii.AAC.1
MCIRDSGPLRGSESAKARDPHSAGPSARGAALRAVPPPPGSAAGWSPTFADSEPPRGPFGPLGARGPQPPRARVWAPSSP